MLPYFHHSARFALRASQLVRRSVQLFACRAMHQIEVTGGMQWACYCNIRYWVALALQNVLSLTALRFKEWKGGGERRLRHKDKKQAATDHVLQQWYSQDQKPCLLKKIYQKKNNSALETVLNCIPLQFSYNSTFYF